jgi:hypothetical protein
MTDPALLVLDDEPDELEGLRKALHRRYGQEYRVVREAGAPQRMVPGVELGAVILAESSPVPAKTGPWPPYERALHALGLGDVDGTLHARVRLLGEIADLLTDTPAGPDGTPETVPSWIHDAGADLRAQLSIEAERLCQSAARVDAVRREIGHRAGRRAFRSSTTASTTWPPGTPTSPMDAPTSSTTRTATPSERRRRLAGSAVSVQTKQGRTL